MIGFYAHHHGSGHAHRCRAIMAALGGPAQLLSTDPAADVVLAEDAGAPADADLDAHGTLHYAPVGHAGLRGRMAQIAAWIAEHRPAAFYVDVSVEVASLVRLMGVPVITLAMPGARHDAAHQHGYRQADAIIAAWPNWVPLPAHLRAHGARVHQVGGIARVEEVGEVIDGDIVVLSGRGGSGWTAGQWDAVRAACPDREFRFLGGGTAVVDPLPYLAGASVVVSAAGQGSVADIAVAGTPALVLPQDRPFGEQHATATLLDSAALALVRPDFPDPGQWPQLLDAAKALDSRWIRWQTSGAATRAADVIRKVVHQ
ncbi:glycosyltransferase [Corynebacterium nasicanis]|uniref:Glycosyltransferase n=1 Tax=Corynebacterium nasicanis TaxID=1448267 RepID=A0ABW1QBX8_9CORY